VLYINMPAGLPEERIPPAIEKLDNRRPQGRLSCQMWRNDRIQMIARDCAIIPARAVLVAWERAAIVVRVVWVTDELFRQ